MRPIARTSTTFAVALGLTLSAAAAQSAPPLELAQAQPAKPAGKVAPLSAAAPATKAAAPATKSAITKPATVAASKPPKKSKPPAASAASPAGAGSPKPNTAAAEQITPGVLSPDEMALDCKRMAGRMRVRLLELRGGGPIKPSSGFAEGLQSAVVPIFGGTSRGMSATGDRSTDIAKLRVMNAVLKQKHCPHYDLDAELAQPHSGPTPRLVKAAKP